MRTVMDQMPRFLYSGIHLASTDYSIDLLRVKDGDHITPNLSHLENCLCSVHDGQYVTSHFQSTSQIYRLVEKLEYVTIFIYRDPRDIVISNYYFIEKQDSSLHERYRKEYSTKRQRLNALIAGFESSGEGRGLASIGVVVANYIDWLKHPSTLCVRFEDLVGSKGGGSDELQLATLGKIAAHVGRDVDLRRLQSAAHRVWSPRSGTFRTGQIGQWRTDFTEEQRGLFKEVAGEQLIALGYEDDFDW